MDNISWKSWAFQACAHIRFKPDRAAVEEELLAHLEDKAEAILREKELTVYEAERQALASMGDADEVGRQLAAVYRPWLGYLWLWSRRVLIVCIVAVIWAAWGFSERTGFGESDLRWWLDFPGYGRIPGTLHHHGAVPRLPGRERRLYLHRARRRGVVQRGVRGQGGIRGRGL